MSTNELNRPVVRYDTILAFIGAPVGLAIGAYLFSSNYPTVQFLCAYLISYAIAVILHEFGHATAALVCGGTVNLIRLGVRIANATPWEVQFLGLSLNIYGLPFSGSVKSTFDDTRFYRLKRCFVIAAGPLANALLLLVGIAFLNIIPASPHHWLLVGWMLANGSLFLSSIIPRSVRSYGKIQGNDGLNFWNTLNYTDEEIQRFVDHAKLARSLK